MGIRVTKLFAYPANNDSTLVQLYLVESSSFRTAGLDEPYDFSGIQHSVQTCIDSSFKPVNFTFDVFIDIVFNLKAHTYRLQNRFFCLNITT